MNNLMTVHTLGPQLIALLGLPKHCVSFELRCAAGEIVKVKCEFYPEEAEGIDLVLAEYELVPRERPSAVAPCAANDLSVSAWARETGPLLQGMPYDAWVCHRAGVVHAAEAIGFDAWMHERTEWAHEVMMRHARHGGQAHGI
jgi:hypothetical protein